MKFLKDLYKVQEEWADKLSVLTEEHEINQQFETEQENKELYDRCKKDNRFKQLIEFDSLINDKAFSSVKIEAFSNLVERKVLEVEDGNLSYKDFFKTLNNWIDTNG